MKVMKKLDSSAAMTVMYALLGMILLCSNRLWKENRIALFLGLGLLSLAAGQGWITFRAIRRGRERKYDKNLLAGPAYALIGAAYIYRGQTEGRNFRTFDFIMSIGWLALAAVWMYRTLKSVREEQETEKTPET